MKQKKGGRSTIGKREREEIAKLERRLGAPPSEEMAEKAFLRQGVTPKDIGASAPPGDVAPHYEDAIQRSGK